MTATGTILLERCAVLHSKAGEYSNMAVDKNLMDERLASCCFLWLVWGKLLFGMKGRNCDSTTQAEQLQ